MCIEFLITVISNKKILIFIRWQSLYTDKLLIRKINNQKKFQIIKKKKSKIFFFSNFFFGFLLLNHEKQNQKIAGITNCAITKCGDPLYQPPSLQIWKPTDGYYQVLTLYKHHVLCIKPTYHVCIKQKASTHCLYINIF